MVTGKATEVVLRSQCWSDEEVSESCQEPEQSFATGAQATEVRMPQAVKKRGPGGRPTKYKPAFCDRAFDFVLVGMSDGKLAGAIKIDEAMLYRWKNS